MEKCICTAVAGIGELWTPRRTSALDRMNGERMDERAPWRGPLIRRCMFILMTLSRLHRGMNACVCPTLCAVTCRRKTAGSAVGPGGSFSKFRIERLFTVYVLYVKRKRKQEMRTEVAGGRKKRRAASGTTCICMMAVRNALCGVWTVLLPCHVPPAVI